MHGLTFRSNYHHLELDRRIISGTHLALSRSIGEIYENLPGIAFFPNSLDYRDGTEGPYTSLIKRHCVVGALTHCDGWDGSGYAELTHPSF